MKKIILDNRFMECTPEGVEPFFWPLARKEIVDVAEFLITAFKDFIGPEVNAGNEDAKDLLTLNSKLYVELIKVFQACLLSKRFKEKEYEAVLPEKGPVWDAAFNMKKPPENPFVAAFEKGVVRPPLWKRFLRPLRDISLKDSFVRRPVEMIDMKKDTVCITYCPLTLSHAEKMDERVVLCPLNEWLYPPEKNALKGIEGVSEKFIDEFLNIIEKGYVERGAELPEYMKEYLKDWIVQSSVWIRYYKKRINENPDRIPKKLWIGTSGIIWSRILADVVKDKGGQVIAHDHACGANYTVLNRAPFVETQNVDGFVTFTKAQADLYKKIVPDVNITGKIPEIKYVSVPSVKTEKQSMETGEKDRKKALYVMSFFSTDMCGPSPMLPPIVAVDWQIRLFRKLQEFGYDVLIKPHPESPQPPPEYFEKELGVEHLTGRFEDEYQKGDVLLFDFPLTTTWGHALATEKPIVYLDFGMAPLPEDTEALLKKRCAVTKCSFDENNRANTDWAELEKDLKKAETLFDDSYAKTVLGN